MAQRTQITFTDDIDGSDAEGTVTFALNGAQYEIDLSKKNSDKLQCDGIDIAKALRENYDRSSTIKKLIEDNNNLGLRLSIA